MINQPFYLERDLRALHMRDERARPIEEPFFATVQKFGEGQVRVNMSPPRPSTPTSRGKLHIRYSGQDAITVDTQEGKPTITVKVGNRSRPPSPGLPPARSPSPASPTVTKQTIFREEIITPVKNRVPFDSRSNFYPEGAPSQLLCTVPIGVRRVASSRPKIQREREIPIQRPTYTTRKDVSVIVRNETKSPSIPSSATISSSPSPDHIERKTPPATTDYVNVPNTMGFRHPSPPRVLTPKQDKTPEEASNEYLKAVSELPDFYGICNKCSKAIIGAENGCSAIDQIYHNSCFKCQICDIELQGLPFYCLDKHAYCESCYMNTLEKCCQCKKPISDRIVRATGKPYHPNCFSCTVCKQSLDGVPFTVDASNQIYCIEDFHRKFAPRCYACSKPIVPSSGSSQTIRIVAMDKSFHLDCYKCHDCKLALSSEADGRGCYPLDDLILCKACNATRIQRLTSNLTTEL